MSVQYSPYGYSPQNFLPREGDDIVFWDSVFPNRPMRGTFTESGFSYGGMFGIPKERIQWWEHTHSFSAFVNKILSK